MPNCPHCESELREGLGACGDADPDCDCDNFWFCDKCELQFVQSCPAHRGYWAYEELRDD